MCHGSVRKCSIKTDFLFKIELRRILINKHAYSCQEITIYKVASPFRLITFYTMDEGKDIYFIEEKKKNEKDENSILPLRQTHVVLIHIF